MSKFKRSCVGRRLRLLGIAVAGLLPVAHRATAGTLYFEPSGITNGGSYSWDAANWSTSSTSGSGDLNWTAGDFAEFTNGNTYTVTVGQTESMAGMYTTTSSSNLTINQAASTSGNLSVVAAAGSNGVDNLVQGFLMDGPTVINAPITGAGGIQPQYIGSGAALSLFGNNSYAGGTLLTSSSTLVYFNNNNSFGTGTIYPDYAAGSYAPLLSSGGALITLPNNWQNAGSGGGVNFASGANTPVTSTGTWSIGSSAFVLRNNGNSTAPLTLSGAISGSGALSVQGNGGSGGSGVGTTTFSGGALNTYSGVVTVGAPSYTAITLKMGAANSLSDATGLTLSGGTFNPGGFSQSMTSAPLAMTVSSVIDFGAGGAELDFADSSTQSWSGTLNLANWNPSIDTINFADATGLTSGQLAEIEANGDPSTLGTAYLTASGNLVVPEPASLSLLGVVGLGILGRRRRKTV